MINPMVWRERHPRCEFCEYYKLAIPARVPGPAMRDFFECIVKRKTIKYSKMPRPWCQCFRAKYVNFIGGEKDNNERDSKV